MLGLLRMLPSLRAALPSLALVVAAGMFVAQWHQLNETRDALAVTRAAVEERDAALAEAEAAAAAAVEKAARILANEQAQASRQADRAAGLDAAQHECLSRELPPELLE